MSDSPGPQVLNLGSGRKPVPGALNVDVSEAAGADLVVNLNQLPWPFESSRFDEVLAFDVIEHLDDVVAAMAEVHRVAKDGARFRATVPHFSSANAFTDITHRHHFGWQSFEYFTGEHEFSYYSAVKFRCLARSLLFHPGLLNKLVWRFANRHPQLYERRLTWILPAWFVYVELEVLKETGAPPP